MSRFGWVHLCCAHASSALALTLLSRPLPPAQSQDLTDPSSRLVSHNRLHSPHNNNPKMMKLRPNESVLSARELQEQKGDGEMALAELSLGGEEEGEEGEEGVWTAPEEEESSAVEEKEESAPVRVGAVGGWRTKEGGVPLVLVKQKQWNEVCGIADVCSCFPHLVRVARSPTVLGARRLNPRPPPRNVSPPRPTHSPPLYSPSPLPERPHQPSASSAARAVRATTPKRRARPSWRCGQGCTLLIEG